MSAARSTRKNKKKRTVVRVAVIICAVLLVMTAVWAWLFVEMRSGKFIDTLAFPNDELILETGDTEALSVEFAPAFVTDKTLVFSSSDESVAAVSDKGVVTAIAAGETKITVRHVASGKTDTMTVRVEGGEETAPLTLTPTALVLTVGNTGTLKSDAYADVQLAWTSSDENVATVDRGTVTAVGEGECTVTAELGDGRTAEAKITVRLEETVVEVDPEPASTDTPPEPTIEQNYDLTYVNGILIVNKTYSCPESYCPGVDSDARAAFYEMQAGAEADGISLWVQSGFRDYATQQKLYNAYVSRDGQSLADTYSARPGHSEHQTGLCYDVNMVDDSFANTAEGKWLAEHCWEYGFIIRYPKGCEEHTGYQYEPWHIRYLGVELAEKVYKSGLCLEEYLGITSEYAD